MNLIIQRLDGTEYKMQDYGLKTLDFRVDSPIPRIKKEVIDGRSGYLDMDTEYEGRTMQASFFMRSVDGPDFPLLRNEIFRIFESRESFYLIDDREPGKRWLVKCDGGYTIEQLVADKGRFTAKFTSYSAYAESVGTTLDPMTFDSELWQVGQGLTGGDDMNYVHSTPTFSIFNAGDTAIDPREHPLVITYAGASNGLTITNTTTSDEWSYTGSTLSTDVIEINGIRSLKNGASIFANTNRKLITLAKGWNDFVITGATEPFELKFNLRFYYL